MLISDWVHRSAFEDFQVTLDLGIPAAQSIVVNGTGASSPFWKNVMPAQGLIIEHRSLQMFSYFAELFRT